MHILKYEEAGRILQDLRAIDSSIITFDKLSKLKDPLQNVHDGFFLIDKLVNLGLLDMHALIQTALSKLLLAQQELSTKFDNL